MPAMHPPVPDAFPGTTSADSDHSQSVIMGAQPRASQGYFDKYSLSRHLLFGFI
jgi:hypothetical protein